MSSFLTRGRTRAGGAVLAVAGLALALSGGAVAAPAPGLNDHSGPVINANFADPDLLQVGNVYHAYATNSGGEYIQHETSTDLVHWTKQPDAAPTLGAWVATSCTFTPGGATDRCVWAPEVSKVGSSYVLYYAARDAASDKQCIGVSTSASPNGPFVPASDKPLICPTDTGAIDPSTYVENGQLYLLWKADGNCCNLPAIIYLQKLSADGLTLTSPPQELIRNDQLFEGAVVEAPTLVKHGSTYYLFYSSNVFSGGNYKTGYATSTSLTGPYTKAREPLMTTDLFRGSVIGPGGQDIVTLPNGLTGIVFHGWDPTYTYRAMYVRTLDWWNGVTPHVRGTATRYEAEDGVVANARVVPDDTASAGAKVGGLDNLDSSVTLHVQASSAGTWTLGIWFGNGSLDPSGYKVSSSQNVSVNGSQVATVVYPFTTWQNWTRQDLQVHLNKGANTITFTKATFYTELDAVDVSQ